MENIKRYSYYTLSSVIVVLVLIVNKYSVSSVAYQNQCRSKNNLVVTLNKENPVILENTCFHRNLVIETDSKDDIQEIRVDSSILTEPCSLLDLYCLFKASHSLNEKNQFAVEPNQFFHRFIKISTDSENTIQVLIYPSSELEKVIQLNVFYVIYTFMRSWKFLSLFLLSIPIGFGYSIIKSRKDKRLVLFPILLALLLITIFKEISDYKHRDTTYRKFTSPENLSFTETKGKMIYGGFTDTDKAYVYSGLEGIELISAVERLKVSYSTHIYPNLFPFSYFTRHQKVDKHLGQEIFINNDELSNGYVPSFTTHYFYIKTYSSIPTPFQVYLPDAEVTYTSNFSNFLYLSVIFIILFIYVVYNYPMTFKRLFTELSTETKINYLNIIFLIIIFLYLLFN